jgi:hypothetical protein
MSRPTRSLSNPLNRLLAASLAALVLLASDASLALPPCDRALTIDRSHTKYLATDPHEPDLAAEGVLDDDGDLRVGLYTKRQNGVRPLGTPMRGAEQFEQIVKHFDGKVKRIEADFDPSSDLMTEFNDLIAKGLSPKKAVLGTWIGKQCAKFGFTEVTIAELQNSHYGYIFADFYFSKPSSAQ